MADDYLKALEIELSWLEQPRTVQTLFIGGGTPTHLTEPQLDRLFDALNRWLPLQSASEVTVECNPSDITPAKLDLLCGRGVTRLSIGAQSFNPDKLRRLERNHGPEQVVRAVEMAASRFQSVSLDLIFAAPNETLESWEQDLQQATSLGQDLQHISTYGLTFEHGTTFWNRRARGELQQLEDSLEAEMYSLAIDHLTANGFNHYEVSNFARVGSECRHNMVYWRGEPYFAFGAGAARYINGRRETNQRSTSSYLKKVLSGESPIAESEQLSPAAKACEQLIFGLRMMAGVDLDDFQSTTGFDVDELAGPEVGRFINSGLLERVASRLRLTRKGLMLSDSIWPELLTHQ